MKLSAFLAASIVASIVMLSSSHAIAERSDHNGEDTHVRALRKAMSAAREHRFDLSERTIVITDSREYVVVFFFNATPQRRARPRVVYDPRIDKIVFIAGDG
jgi:hypothetical protein